LSSRDVQVRWRARLVSANQRRSSSMTCGDTQGLSVHTFMLTRPVRSQVACEDALYGSHTHFKDKNVFNHCMPSKATMSSHISNMTISSVITCLQKATINLIYISKTTMPSVIACLQKATMSSFKFRRRQCLQSLHTFKGDNVLIYISKMAMSSVIECLQKETMSSFVFRRQQCLHLKNFNIFFQSAS